MGETKVRIIRAHVDKEMQSFIADQELEGARAWNRRIVSSQVGRVEQLNHRSPRGFFALKERGDRFELRLSVVIEKTLTIAAADCLPIVRFFLIPARDVVVDKGK